MSLRRVPLAPVLAMLAPSALAAEAGSVGVGELFRLAGGLVLILALILGLAYAAQRVKRLQQGQARHLKVVEALSLGTRDRLLLVEADGERLLLALAGGRIERLHVLAPGVPAHRFAAELATAGGQPTEAVP